MSDTRHTADMEADVRIEATAAIIARLPQPTRDDFALEAAAGLPPDTETDIAALVGDGCCPFDLGVAFGLRGFGYAAALVAALQSGAVVWDDRAGLFRAA